MQQCLIFHNQSRGPGCVFESRFSAEDAEKKKRQEPE